MRRGGGKWREKRKDPRKVNVGLSQLSEITGKRLVMATVTSALLFYLLFSKPK